VVTRRSVLLAGGIGLLFALRLSRAQPQSKTPRIGILWVGSKGDPSFIERSPVFRQRLSALGYVEGKNILIEERFTDGNSARLGELALELAAMKVDVIVTPTVAASTAARRATPTIPQVFLSASCMSSWHRLSPLCLVEITPCPETVTQHKLFRVMIHGSYRFSGQRRSLLTIHWGEVGL